MPTLAVSAASAAVAGVSERTTAAAVAVAARARRRWSGETGGEGKEKEVGVEEEEVEERKSSRLGPRASASPSRASSPRARSCWWPLAAATATWGALESAEGLRQERGRECAAGSWRRRGNWEAMPTTDDDDDDDAERRRRCEQREPATLLEEELLAVFIIFPDGPPAERSLCLSLCLSVCSQNRRGGRPLPERRSSFERDGKEWGNRKKTKKKISETLGQQRLTFLAISKNSPFAPSLSFRPLLRFFFRSPQLRDGRS